MEGKVKQEKGKIKGGCKGREGMDLREKKNGREEKEGWKGKGG